MCLTSVTTYTHTHYAVVDLFVFPATATAVTFIDRVSFKVLESNFLIPVVLLDSND